MRLSRRRIGTSAAALASAGALAAAVIVGAGHGNPAREVNLLSGAAWLASAQVGQVTLLDGSSAEVAAQVKVADPGASVDVVQQGSTAYAINHTAGTITRVDGATFDTGKPATPIPDAHAGLTAFAGTGPLYALDTQRGLLVATNARTLATQGEPQSLAAKLTAGSATMDDAGHLWLIDQATGDLTRVEGAQQTTHRATAKPGNSVLTMAGDNPVVVDIVDRKAIRVDPEAVAPDTVIDLDLAPDDKVQASGSPHGQRLYVVSSRGVLTICDLAAAKCGATIPIAAPATTFGPAVEAGNRVFVPDYTGGRVWIVDLTTHVVIAKPQILPPGQFQLLTRDGVVFFNDPNTEKAGVVRIDGGVRNAAKYDPADPNKGLNAPQDSKAPSVPPSNNQVPPSSNPNQPQTTTPPPDTQQPTQPTVPNQPTIPTQPTVPTQPPPTQQPKPKPKLGIKVSKANPMVDENIGLEVTNSTGGIASAKWNFGDGKTATGAQPSHAWDTAGTFQVSVQVTAPDGQKAATSLTVTVSAKPKHTLHLTISGAGTISGGPVDCSSTCDTSMDEGTRIVLRPTPGPGYYFFGFGACDSPDGPEVNQCTMIMNATKSTTATFRQAATLTITLRKLAGADGTVTGTGVTCSGDTCQVSVPPGTPVSVTGVGDANSNFTNWAHCPDGNFIKTCTYPMLLDTTDTATFQPKN